MVPSSNEATKDVILDSNVSHELRRRKIQRKAKSFSNDFQLYLVEGSRDKIANQYSYCFSVEEDPKSFDEAMKSQDVAFWREAINDEMDSIMCNNTWVLSDLSLGCNQRES